MSRFISKFRYFKQNMKEIEFSHLQLNNHVLSAVKSHFCESKFDLECKIQKWFASTPKVSTVRVNSLKYTNVEVLELLKTDIIQNNFNCEPDIKVHDKIPNCILIGPLKNVEFHHGEAEIIVDSACGCAVLRGANIFAPGVIGMPPSVKSGTIVDILVDIKRECKKGSKYFNGSKIYIGSGIALFNRQDLFKNNIKGRLIAIDKTSNKIEKIINLCKSFEITNVTCFAFDSTKIFDENKNKENYKPPFGLESFDRILLDGPCSALGQRPRFDLNVSVKQLESHPNVQKQLFSNAVPLLRRGGYLVYSTCTITLEENEKIVEWALNKFKNLKLCETTPYIGLPGLPESNLLEEQRKLVQRFGNQQGEDTIGFFIAKFTKT